MMRVVDRPIFPSGCVVCGSTSNGPFLDTGLPNKFSVKQHRVYLCNQHFLEVLKVEKLVPVAELEEQVGRLGEALGQIVRLEELARTATAEAAVLQVKLDEQESSIQSSRSTIRFLEQRVAELTADPSLVEHQRAVAELTGSAS
jgi:hypothetical protein